MCQATGNQHVNDNMPDKAVFIIIGTVYRRKGGPGESVHVILSAADDDSAVRKTLDALAREGYAEADLDQIGTFDAVPIDEPHATAFQDALEGEIAIIEMGKRSD